jgi:prenyltransferase beta subunit
MLDVCPLCGRPLRNGVDGPQYIKYDPEWRAKFDAGQITLDELSQHITVYYDRARLCFNEGNQNTFADDDGKVHLMNPPCPNYYGRNNGTIENPFVVVETVTIEDN